MNIFILFFISLFASFNAHSAAATIEHTDLRFIGASSLTEFNPLEYEKKTTYKMCLEAPTNQGAYALVLLTKPHVIRFSNEPDIDNLLTTFGNIQATAHNGFSLVTPEKIIPFAPPINDYNTIQIIPFIEEKAPMFTIIMNAFMDEAEKSLNIIKCLGRSMGLFQKSTLDVDQMLSACHGDFKIGNILLTSCHEDGTNCTFSLIDNEEYSYNSLVIDPTYFFFSCENIFTYSFDMDRFEKILQKFYAGYIEEFQDNPKVLAHLKEMYVQNNVYDVSEIESLDYDSDRHPEMIEAQNKIVQDLLNKYQQNK